MSQKATSEPKPEPEGEHIFPETRLADIARRWQVMHKAGDEGALELLEQIIVESTPMFRRFAQHENFHLTVDLEVLVTSAQQKVPRWLEKWEPKKGRLFSWFTKCAKNVFRGEAVKVSAWRKKHYTFGLVNDDSDPSSAGYKISAMEKMLGLFTDPEVYTKAEGARHLKKDLHNIYSRWGSETELGAIRYILSSFESIDDDEHSRQNVIRGVGYAWGLSSEMARFFYNWCLVSLRDVMYERQNVGSRFNSLKMTPMDIFLSKHSYSFIPDMLNIVDWDQMLKLIAVFGGMRVKFPTVSGLKKDIEKHKMMVEMMKSDMDPKEFSKIAKKYGKTDRTAQQIFTDLTDEYSQDRTAEIEVFTD